MYLKRPGSAITFKQVFARFRRARLRAQPDAPPVPDVAGLPHASVGTRGQGRHDALRHPGGAAGLLGTDTPIVIAHDFGGATTLRTHILEKCDFARMTLIDPVAVAPWGSPFVQHVRRYFDAFAGVAAYSQDGILNAYIQDALTTAPAS